MNSSKTQVFFDFKLEAEVEILKVLLSIEQCANYSRELNLRNLRRVLRKQLLD